MSAPDRFDAARAQRIAIRGRGLVHPLALTMCGGCSRAVWSLALDTTGRCPACEPLDTLPYAPVSAGRAWARINERGEVIS